MKIHECKVVKRWLGFGKCCESCHYDYEELPYGQYPLMEKKIGNHILILCCSVAHDVQHVINL